MPPVFQLCNFDLWPFGWPQQNVSRCTKFGDLSFIPFWVVVLKGVHTYIHTYIHTYRTYIQTDRQTEGRSQPQYPRSTPWCE